MGGQLPHLKKWHAEIVAKIAIPVGTGQLVHHFMRDSRLEELNVPAGLFYTLNSKMVISTTNMAATTAPKCHIVFNRVIDQDAVIIKLIVTKWRATKSTLLRAEEVEVPPKPNIELSIKPKCTVKLELRGESVRRESIPAKRGIP